MQTVAELAAQESAAAAREFSAAASTAAAAAAQAYQEAAGEAPVGEAAATSQHRWSYVRDCTRRESWCRYDSCSPPAATFTKERAVLIQ